MKTQIIAFAILFVTITNTTAQQKELTNTQKNTIVQLVSENLLETYIDFDLAKEMSKEIKQHVKSKKYNAITNPLEFSKVVTQDLQKISRDLHLKLNFEPKRIAQSKRKMPAEIKRKRDKMMAIKMAEINYGFSEVKVLNGNIGYLNLRMFADIEQAKEAATAAMSFLSNTNAILIDLRTNGGGVPSMMQLLSSYFTSAEPVVLSDFYERKTNSKTQLLTFQNIDGKRMTNTPLYILTSKSTFSAAEAFAYSLKHLDKAKVVGEVTKGGANRTKRINLDENFSVSMPYIQAIHPVTKTNWEGTGVQPNIKTTAKEAFVNAYIAAILKTAKENKQNILNSIGYDFLKEKSIDEALVVFHQNAKLFPNDANSWDSLGEAYFHKRDKENALKAYKKALALDPNSSSAKKMIDKLERIQ